MSNYLIANNLCAPVKLLSATTRRQALQHVKELAGQRPDHEFLLFELVGSYEVQKSYALGEKVPKGWYEVWQMKGGERNSSSRYCASNGESCVYFDLYGNVSTPEPVFQEREYRLFKCNNPFSRKQNEH